MIAYFKLKNERYVTFTIVQFLIKERNFVRFLISGCTL